MTTKKEKSTLPSLQDLYLDKETAFKNDQFNLLMNQQPPKEWIKQHPFLKNSYLPIERVEHLLTMIFTKWSIEIISYTQVFNSVAVHVRLHYVHPITNKESYQDGLGAQNIQTDKGAAAFDLASIKSDAVMKALPAAESYAIKDAAEKLGDIFGKNLNRKDAPMFNGQFKGEKPDQQEAKPEQKPEPETVPEQKPKKEKSNNTQIPNIDEL